MKTLFTPGTKQHVISALGETFTRVVEEGMGWGAVGRKGRKGEEGSKAEIKPQHKCDHKKSDRKVNKLC